MPKPKGMHKAALGVTRWIGSTQSIFLHTFFFAASILLMFLHIFPLDIVILVFTLVVSLEAIYLSLFIQLTVNYQSASLAEVEQDIDEIQGDVDEIQEDIEELSEDVEEMVEEEQSEEVAEEARNAAQQKTLGDIHTDLRKLMSDIEKLQQPRN